jgi:hypothetical protein
MFKRALQDLNELSNRAEMPILSNQLRDLNEKKHQSWKDVEEDCEYYCGIWSTFQYPKYDFLKHKFNYLLSRVDSMIKIIGVLKCGCDEHQEVLRIFEQTENEVSVLLATVLEGATADLSQLFDLGMNVTKRL